VYSKNQEITLQMLREHENPAFMLGGFVRFLYLSKVAEHKRKEAMPALQLNMDVVRPEYKPKDSIYLQTVILGYTVTTVIQSRYKSIWDLIMAFGNAGASDDVATGPESGEESKRRFVN
jgi:hypothetical protein